MRTASVRSRLVHTGVLAVYLLLAAWYTHPLLSLSRTHVIGDPPGDPLLNASVLWWNATTLPLTDAWWNPPHFYPDTASRRSPRTCWASARSRRRSTGYGQPALRLQPLGLSGLAAVGLHLVSACEASDRPVRCRFHCRAGVRLLDMPRG